MRLTDTVLQRVTESEYDLAERPMRIRHRSADGTHLYTGEVTYNGYNDLPVSWVCVCWILLRAG